jgi:hypothetical protein
MPELSHLDDAPTAEPVATPRAWARIPPAIDWLLIAWGLLCVAGLERLIEGDGERRWLALDALLREHRIFAQPYSMVGPTLAAPLWWLGSAFGSGMSFVAAYNQLLLGAFALAAAGLLSRDLGGRTARRFALACLAASMLPAHSTQFYGEVFTAVLVGLGAMLLARRHWLGAPLTALGAANTPQLGLGVLLLALLLAAREKRRLDAFVLVAVFTLPNLAENWLERGSMIDFGSTTGVGAGVKTALPFSGLPGFSYPFWFGVMSILLSFGKGLVFFTPGAFLPLAGSPLPGGPKGAEHARRICGYLLAFVVGAVLVYAKWWSWYGGWFWGPRFFLLASVLAAFKLALLDHGGSRARSLVILAALALSCWVSIDGASFGMRGLDVCGEVNNYQFEAFSWYTPELSPLWHPLADPSVWHMPPAAGRYMTFAIAAFVWLALPVLRALVRPAAITPARGDAGAES